MYNSNVWLPIFFDGQLPWKPYRSDYEICKLKTPIAVDGRTKKIVSLGTTAEYNQYVKTGKASCVIGKYAG